jgi:hypothetical protein
LGLKSDSSLSSNLSFTTTLLSTLRVAWEHLQKQENKTKIKKKKKKTKILNSNPKLDPSLSLGSSFTTELFSTPRIGRKCPKKIKKNNKQKT